jgi:hypothetical protein
MLGDLAELLQSIGGLIAKPFRSLHQAHGITVIGEEQLQLVAGVLP